MLQTLLKVMRRFMKAGTLEGKYGAALGSVSCQDVKLQLADSELVIGDKTRKALTVLKPDKQKAAQYHTCHSRGHPSTTNFWENLDALILHQKGPEIYSQVHPESFYRKPQPQLDDSSVLPDEWKLFQVDREVSELDTSQWIEHYWNAVFLLKLVDGNSRYQSLPLVIKCGLVAQTKMPLG